MNNEHKDFSVSEIKKNIDSHLTHITNEFKNGFEELKKHPKSVTIFGSSRSQPQNPHFKQAEELAQRIVNDLGYAIITGGGPGIMAAANLGAREAGGHSIGFTIKLPMEQHTNPYVSSEVRFDYFFTRKAMLSFAAEAYVFFPGGFGTFDELFGILTLMQTKKIPRVPVVLIGKDFWNALLSFLSTNMLDKHHAIEKSDLDYFIVTDNIDKAMEIIKKAPVSEWWKTMN